MKVKNPQKYAIVILVLICLGIFVPNFSQYQVSGFGSRLIETMGLTTSQFAQIATASLIPGIFLSLIVGILVDRFGARRPLIIAMACTAAGVIWRAFAVSYTELYLSMILIGVGATFLASNNAKIFGQWFSPEKTAVTVGIYLGVSNGAIALGTGTASLFPSVKTAFIFSGALAVVLVLAYVLFMRDREPVRRDVPQPRGSVLEGLKICLKNKYVWAAALCLMLDITAFCSLSQFLPQALAWRGLSDAMAGTVAMALTLGGLVSCFTAPYLLMRLGHTKLVITVCGILSALGIAFAWRISDNIVVLFIAIFATGFFSTSFTPLLTSLPVRLKGIGIQYAGTAGGVIATIQLAGTVIIPSYIVSPIAGSNYTLMFLLFGALDVLLCFAVHLLPRAEKF